MLRVIGSNREELDFFHGMMMVCNVAIIFDGYLIDLDANTEVVATSTLSIARIDVVLLVFGKIIPFRVSG
jgi:hypothetical protein